MKYKEYAVIIDKQVKGSYLTLKIKTEKIAKESSPGQFVNIRVSETYDPLLRRPVSICNAEGDVLTLMLLLKGKGTKILAQKNVGDLVNLIGPLGNSFLLSDKEIICVAGGIGVAPFLFLSKALSKKPTLIFGVRGKDYMPDLSEFQTYFKDIIVSSDDGTAGRKGTVIDTLVEQDLPGKVLYACGPDPMFRAINKILHNCGNVEAYYSLETMMGCGFGACKGCTVETPGGDYKLSCKDGPIFRWDEVKL